MKSNQWLIALGLGLALGLLWPLGSQNNAALADPGILYVAPGGNCGGAMPCYATVQTAVDAASAGDEIRVAAGTYAGVSAHAGVTQTVYISKTVTIRGGYTTVNWTTPDAAANPTTLDAQRLGRVLYITADPSAALRQAQDGSSGQAINPTVEGLRITGGDAAGLGGAPWQGDAGGGVYVTGVMATIRNCVVINNTASTTLAGYGGGLYLYSSDATLSGNTVQDNEASTASYGYGGGLYLEDSDATLSGNTVISNAASTASDGLGGGLYLGFGDTTLSGNTVVSNTASTASVGKGGGLYLSSSPAVLNANTVQGNTASTARYGYGGGLYLGHSDAKLANNAVQGNTASTTSDGWGGGLYLVRSGATVVSGNKVQGNIASTASYGHGGGLYLGYSAATLTHNTVQGNTASAAYYGYGGGLYLSSSDATLNDNTVRGNTASTASGGSGGGLYLEDSDAMLSGNTIVSNSASTASWGYGGGLYVYRNDATLINNVVADNQANTQGGGLYFKGSDTDPTWSRLLHTTIADNGSTGLVLSPSTLLGMHKAEGPALSRAEGRVLSRAEGLTAGRSSGQGVFADEYTTLAFTNTIIAGHHSVGITVTAGSTAALNATLWHANSTDYGGNVIHTNDHSGDPAFAPDGYHLTTGSAAIDAGVDAGVTTDIDGHPRPWGAGYDIGADEFRQWYVYLPLVMKDHAN